MLQTSFHELLLDQLGLKVLQDEANVQFLEALQLGQVISSLGGRFHSLHRDSRHVRTESFELALLLALFLLDLADGHAILWRVFYHLGSIDLYFSFYRLSSATELSLLSLLLLLQDKLLAVELWFVHDEVLIHSVLVLLDEPLSLSRV